MDINNKFKNTKSQFIYKSGLLSGYVAHRLDNNQNIKRYLRYPTLNLLGDEAIKLNSALLQQPATTDSL